MRSPWPPFCLPTTAWRLLLPQKSTAVAGSEILPRCGRREIEKEAEKFDFPMTSGRGRAGGTEEPAGTRVRGNQVTVLRNYGLVYSQAQRVVGEGSIFMERILEHSSMEKQQWSGL